MKEQIRTQISGKYSPDNLKLFDFKQQVVGAGLDVRFPVGDEILQYSHEFAVTHLEEATTPFHSTEIKFFREIKGNHIQIAYNIYGEREGYVGESTGIEIAYAMLCKKPVVLLREPSEYSVKMPQTIEDILERHKGQFLVKELDRMNTDEISTYLDDISEEEVDYELSAEEEDTIMNECLALSRRYRGAWEQYKVDNGMTC